MSNLENGKIGLFDSAMILVGGMIGSAIFSLSGVTISEAGPASIISWIIAAAILFAYALQTAELSTTYPHSGGVFVFPEKTLGKTPKQGRLWGWISAWAYLFGNIAAVTFSAMYIGIYLGVGFSALNNYQLVIGIIAVIVPGVLNLMSVSSMGKVNTGITIVHVATMAIFVVVALFSGKWDSSNFVPFFTQGTGGAGGFLSAIPVAMLAYGSIVAIAFMVGEIKNPKKTVPAAMTIAMLIVVAVYVLMMVSTLGLITAQYLQENPGMTYIPIFAAAFTALSNIPWLVKLIAITAVLGLFTTTLICMTLTARTFQACAASGLLPKSLAKNSEKSGVPVNAEILTIVICGVLAAFPSFINVMVNMGALCTVFVIAIICLSVIAARKKNPDVEGKFKAPGGNVLSILVLIVLVVCYIPSIIEGGWQLWAWTGGYYAIGMIIYFIATKKADAAEAIEQQKRRRCTVKYIDGVDFSIDNACVVFGDFDGVHIGHRAVINKLLETSKRGLTSVIVCFDHGTDGEKYLSSAEEKVELLSEHGPDVFISYPWDANSMTTERFIKEVLVDRLGAKIVVVGKNDPDVGILRTSGEKYGFSVEECDTVTADGEPVSTERIKKELTEGSLEKANELLGHPYLMIGEVMHGKALGRTVGMPTANLGVSENKIMPRYAVYATLSIIEGERFKGLTNIGLRPSVDSFQYPTIETFLLDFAKDIYGKRIKLEVQMLIRDIQKFDSLDEVKLQVNKDLEFVNRHVKSTS